MKTILIQGGTDGMGRALADYYLKEGYNVIIVGHSKEKGNNFLQFAKDKGAIKRATFIKADLSLISENNRVIGEVKKLVDKLDIILFFAANQGFRPNVIRTSEGFEHTFALYYMSRFVLSYGLTPLLEKADYPTIVNVSAPGMKGAVQWNDLQFFDSFESFKAMQHGSRLNDLWAVKYSKEHPSVRTILYNPWLVSTTGSAVSQKNKFMQFLMSIMYKLIGKTPEEAAQQIRQVIEQPYSSGLYAFIKEKPVDLSMNTFNSENSEMLYTETQKLLR